ncbi:MAG TPA: TolC family protein, partial [Gemmatimonadaceae bacterium]|nr:TolC family protein [Gemmatimonadaceae bacterium]
MNPQLIRAALIAALAVLVPEAQAQTSDTLALTLHEAVERALRTSDEVRLAAAQVDVAEAQVITARATGLPQLRLTGTYTHVYENARGQAVGQIFNQPNTYNTNANLSQTIFQGGRMIAGWRAASRLRRASRLNANEARAQVSLDVQRAYLEALFASRMVEIQTANFTLATNRLTQIEQFQTAGRAARYDVLRTRVERANLEPLLIQARSDREIAMLELKRLLNISPSQPVSLTTTIDAGAVQAILASFDPDSTGREMRASVRAAELTARARHDAVSVARADFLPTVSAFLQMGYQAFPVSGFPTDRGRLDPTFCPANSPADRACSNGGWFDDRLIGVTVSWPLFDGLRAKGNFDLARAQARVADLELQLEREEVALEVARARAELDRARSFYTARQQNAQEAEEAFSLASLR